MPSVFTPSHRGGDGPPLVCLHGITDTWRTWELVLPELERHHDVLAPTLLGHAGGLPADGEIDDSVLPDAVERAMDDAGFETAHFAGNSLGGWVSLQLAARGRAESVVALAPSCGWDHGDEEFKQARLEHFRTVKARVDEVVAHADAIAASEEGRRAATEFTTTNFEHIPTDLIAHQIGGVAGCDIAIEFVERGIRVGYELDVEQITCPVRIVWGTADRILPWPAAAVRYQEEWLPNADWVELEGIGHCPQLDVPLETAQLILGFTSPGGQA